MKQNGRFLKSKASVFLIAFFYILAGVNHFISPTFYLKLIPPYLPYPHEINYLSGLIEIVLGLGALNLKTRRVASILLVLMLLAFIPSHIYFISLGSCVSDGLCVSPWIAWMRLLIVHPILILWAYVVSKSTISFR